MVSVSVSVSGCGCLDGGVAVGAKQCLCVPASPTATSFTSSLCCRFPWPSAHQPRTTTSPLHLYSHWETLPPLHPIPSLQPPQPHNLSLKQSADPSSPSPQPPTRQSQRPSRANSAARSWLARRLRRRLGSGFARTRLLGGLEPAVGR